MENNILIETRSLSKKYGSQQIVQDINMHIEKGKVYGLLGRNGAGKTTIMKMLLGLTSVTAGEIYMFGQPLKSNEQETYLRVGSLIEAPGFYPNLTGYENLRVFAALKGTTKKDAIKDVLEMVNLPYKDKKHFSGYSLGMKQRLGLANALLNEPEFLILDEPTNGLDPIGISELRGFIKELSEKKGKTILLSSHQLSEVEQVANTIGVLHENRLIEECNMEDIEKYSRSYLYLQVNNMQKATMLLEQKFNITDYKAVREDTLHIYDFSKEAKEINKLMWENEIAVSALGVTSQNLEEHFKTITGGVGIA